MSYAERLRQRSAAKAQHAETVNPAPKGPAKPAEQPEPAAAKPGSGLQTNGRAKRQEQSKPRPNVNYAASIYVPNVPEDAGEEDLKTLFSGVGEVREAAFYYPSLVCLFVFALSSLLHRSLSSFPPFLLSSFPPFLLSSFPPGL